MIYSNALIGGLLIGLSVTLSLWLLGRITGISGILSQAVFGLRERASHAWRWNFLAGLLLGAWALHAFTGGPTPMSMASHPALVPIAGFLVGFGVALGSGCTSGHGICGMTRFSKRSIVATVTFMLVAIMTVGVSKLW